MAHLLVRVPNFDQGLGRLARASSAPVRPLMMETNWELSLAAETVATTWPAALVTVTPLAVRTATSAFPSPSRS